MLMRLMVGLTNGQVQKESMPMIRFPPGLQPDLLAELLDLMFRFTAVDTVAFECCIAVLWQDGKVSDA